MLIGATEHYTCLAYSIYVTEIASSLTLLAMTVNVGAPRNGYNGKIMLVKVYSQSNSTS
jgi:hypothetical protein